MPAGPKCNPPAGRACASPPFGSKIFPLFVIFPRQKGGIRVNFLGSLISLASAGMLMLSSSLMTLAPQHDIEGLLFLCNREWTIAESYVPASLREADVPGQVRRMRPEAAAALEEMFAACQEETGVTLMSISGYRSYASQKNIYQRKLDSVRGNVAKAQQYVAPPGTSEHTLGLAMDIGQKKKPHLTEAFAAAEGGVWARENCWRFGFILRYDQAWEEITGYSYEPWHFRYVGRELAKEIHDSGLPLELWLPGYRTRRLLALLGVPEAEAVSDPVPSSEPNS